MEKDERIHNGQDHQPQYSNKDEVNFTEPSKIDSAQEKPDIKESGLGRKSAQTPADEQMEPLSQIDEDTKHIQKNKIDKENI